ncbi:hypothetical protein BDV25DRAFT_165405 [Aspergillus avenaceus]|uniref:T6SS Phospholipase effector Tle1-like catalytic domain-containing protein n=1 Tax=Aspergillus avenaceus TaxID=36643 RepID=A0A5N6TFF0_ASPAV|nr:hypothetical protein BDV25DRAFT_165405 [Aspergillus avenaceus]
MERVPFGPAPVPKQFVLCFDGTGNKFNGDASDSNVLKIFRMLDRSKSHQFHYYQPGIGTYVTSKSLSSHGRFHRIKSAYLKAKDSAVGSSFAEHVMGGYKFLMRYYSPGDEIYFIGFSRGAYIARFLAEMLDYVGLLEAGNEELTRFAWKTFAKWQQRPDVTEEDEMERRRLFKYMKAFRETFSRPITRIKFLGLFDTVNSVPRFESAWMQRSKFPYTARSSAKVIRHAVGIDERRAKFRQDLISEVRECAKKKKKKKSSQWKHHVPHIHRPLPKVGNIPEIVVDEGSNGDSAHNTDSAPNTHEVESIYRSVRSSRASIASTDYRYRAPVYRPPRKASLAVPVVTPSTEDLNSIKSGQSGLALDVPHDDCQSEYDYDEEEKAPQDIQEVWFPGGHADIGGGWAPGKNEGYPLSHAPLVWMVHEAQQAGLQFDPRKMKETQCLEEFEGEYSPIRENFDWNDHKGFCQDDHARGEHIHKPPNFKFAVDCGHKEHRTSSSYGFLKALDDSSGGLLHDCLEFGSGLPALSVLSWRLMEYLPFRRMDLQKDGSWKPIRWPLPCGEVRDIPSDAQIHVSALRRMYSDPNYRPGNLIVGGGGRGVKKAPERYGTGKWEAKSHEGDPVREVYVRKELPEICFRIL